MRKKSICAVLLTAAMAATCLAGCGNDSGSSQSGESTSGGEGTSGGGSRR